MGGKVGWVTDWKIKVKLFENVSVFILIRAMHGLQLVVNMYISYIFSTKWRYYMWYLIPGIIQKVL